MKITPRQLKNLIIKEVKTSKKKRLNESEAQGTVHALLEVEIDADQLIEDEGYAEAQYQIYNLLKSADFTDVKWAIDDLPGMKSLTVKSIKIDKIK